MTIVRSVENYLRDHEVDYFLITHPRTESSMETAQEAHVPGDNLAKGVVLKDREGFLLVVIPSDYHVDIDRLRSVLKRDLQMTDEDSLQSLFPDCDSGAVPPIGQVYSIKTVWDPSSSLGNADEVFFEAGDHRELVCVSGESFHELMASADRLKFSHHI